MFGTYRVLLACLVFTQHLGGAPFIGTYAVFGFYILSGYLMTLIMQKNYDYSLVGLSKYAINRILRIYPIYWVSIAISALIILFVGEQASFDYNSAMFMPGGQTDVLRNIFILFPLREMPRLTPPAWALTVELFFYICIGLGASKKKSYVLIWFVLSVAYHVFVTAAGLNWHFMYFYIPAASLPFSVGALVYHYNSDATLVMKRLTKETYSFLPIVFFVLVLLNWGLAAAFNGKMGAYFYINIILNALIVLILSGMKSSPLVPQKLDVWLGNLSYPIYLIHLQVGLIIISLTSVFGTLLYRPSWALMFISTPFVFLAAWLMAVAIENPIESVRTQIKKWH